MKTELLERFGHRVRELREKQELSQEKFAEKVGLDRTYISGIERGVRNPTISTIQRLADGLSITIEKLLKGF